MKSTIPRAAVKSSNIKSVGYQNGTLSVEYIGGGVYDYHGVPEDIGTKAIGAESIGSFLHKNVKDKFKHTKQL